MAHSNPQPPLYLSPPRCFTCGKVTFHLQLDFWKKIQDRAGGAETDLPIRSIGDKDVVEKSKKTVEGEIMDNQGVFRYCCRRMILSQPKETNKVPLPRDGFLETTEKKGGDVESIDSDELDNNKSDDSSEESSNSDSSSESDESTDDES